MALKRHLYTPYKFNFHSVCLRYVQLPIKVVRRTISETQQHRRLLKVEQHHLVSGDGNKCLESRMIGIDTRLKHARFQSCRSINFDLQLRTQRLQLRHLRPKHMVSPYCTIHAVSLSPLRRKCSKQTERLRNLSNIPQVLGPEFTVLT